MFFPRFVKFAVSALALAFESQARAAPLSYGTYYDEELVQSPTCPANILCRTNFPNCLRTTFCCSRKSTVKFRALSL
jgi:hypothetical protein